MQDTILSPARKSIITLYSGSVSLMGHSCRFVLQEKEVESQIEYEGSDDIAAEIAQYNPYGETPTLVDRDFAVYNGLIIIEYLDERLPHPPLMPVDPVNRSRARLMMYRLQRDWLDLLPQDVSQGVDALTLQIIKDGLVAISPLFSGQSYLLGEDFTLVDCILAPLLWRLPLLGIELPPQAEALGVYARRIFERPGFVASLSEPEQTMRC